MVQRFSDFLQANEKFRAKLVVEYDKVLQSDIEFCEEAVTEFFKFMYIKMYLKDYDSEICSPPDRIRDIWRLATVHQKRYKRICGERYQFSDRMRTLKSLEKTIETYNILFKVKSKLFEVIWKFPQTGIYNFNLPITTGSQGQVIASGGTTTYMDWVTPSSQGWGEEQPQDTNWGGKTDDWSKIVCSAPTVEEVD